MNFLKKYEGCETSLLKYCFVYNQRIYLINLNMVLKIKYQTLTDKPYLVKPLLEAKVPFKVIDCHHIVNGSPEKLRFNELVKVSPGY
jgi:hypothetical protein